MFCIREDTFLVWNLSAIDYLAGVLFLQRLIMAPMLKKIQLVKEFHKIRNIPQRLVFPTKPHGHIRWWIDRWQWLANISRNIAKYWIWIRIWNAHSMPATINTFRWFLWWWWIGFNWDTESGNRSNTKFKTVVSCNFDVYWFNNQGGSSVINP